MRLAQGNLVTESINLYIFLSNTKKCVDSEKCDMKEGKDSRESLRVRAHYATTATHERLKQRN